MRTRSFAALGVPVVLATIVGAGAAPGCYRATEISVAVTTTVACSPALVMTTQIFTGATDTTDFGTAPAAETAACGAEEPRIGTLSIVPSGSRDDKFDLEVVGAVGVPTIDCRNASLGLDAVAPGVLVAAKTTGCIVAKRRVSFRPHKSLTVPVLLSAQCIGVPCGVDQTCDLGVCTPTADCTDDGCPRELAAGTVGDGEAGVATDAGADASDAQDASVRLDGSSGHCGAVPQVVVGNQSIAGPLVQQGSDFLYLNATGGAANEVRRVPRAGAATAQTVATASTPGTAFTALAATANDIAWVAQASNATLNVELDGSTSPSASTDMSGTYDQQTLAFSSSLLVGFRRSSGAVKAYTYLLMGNSYPFATLSPVGGAVTRVLVDSLGDFYGTAPFAGVLVHYAVDPVSLTPVEKGKMTLPSLQQDFALHGRTVYVGAAPAAGAGIYRIPAESIVPGFTAPRWISLSAPPQSIAADGTSFYYLVGSSLFRATATTATPPAPVLLANTGTTASTRLAVDDDCVYWIENDSTIMKRAKQ